MVKGFGRWTYCKYCYKYVKPIVYQGNSCQVDCSECGYHLSPFYFYLEHLRKWWNGEELTPEEQLKEDAKFKYFFEKVKQGE